MSYPLSPVVEALEDRRLLAGNPIISLPVGGVFGVTVGVDANAPVKNGKSQSATVKTTSLLGTWEGKVKVNLFLFVSKKYSANIKITGQNATSITGSITVKGKTFTGTFVGKINKDGSFSYKLSKGDTSVKISGNISQDGRSIAGKVSAKYDGWSVGGTFDFKKTA
jgi:hypothetical protein